jgi:PTH1 family peptidyl-tRNA hydrolase
MAFFSFITALFHARTHGSPLPEKVDGLFFGLGNWGGRYAGTRHNIGFMVAEALAARLDDWKEGDFGEAAFVHGTLFSSKSVIVARPRTFVNRSGSAVGRYLNRWQFPAARILVIVDDYQLPMGTLRARRGGSDGGHNGLKSIIQTIGDDFPRLRVGIGPLPPQTSSVDFVLGAFTAEEEMRLKTVIPRAADACVLFAEKGIDAVMNGFNR